MQLRSVCKSWKTLISDSTFVKLHLKRSTRSKHLALFLIPYRHSTNFRVARLPLLRLPGETRVTLTANSNFQLTDAYGFLCPVGSYNGLICLEGRFLTNNYDEIFLYLWNPAAMTLSNKIEFYREFHQQEGNFQYKWKFSFGYDSSTDTYKIVAFHLMTNEVKVLSFGDNVWKNIQCLPMVPTYCAPRFYKHVGNKHGLYVCGTLNWLAIQNKFQYDYQIDWKLITIGQFMIISLDLSTETYRHLMAPQGFDIVPCVQPTLVVLMDSLCFYHDFHGTGFIIWQMMEFGVEESWTQFLKISFQSLPLVPNHRRLCLFPVCLSENGDTLILACGQRKQAILYNLRDNIVEKTRITNEIEWFFSKDYVESLVSVS